MQLKFKHGAGFTKDRDESIPQYFQHLIRESVYSDGLVEQTAEKSDEIGKALGRLIETLAEKKILSACEITYIAESVHRDSAEIITIED